MALWTIVPTLTSRCLARGWEWREQNLLSAETCSAVQNIYESCRTPTNEGGCGCEGRKPQASEVDSSSGCCGGNGSSNSSGCCRNDRESLLMGTASPAETVLALALLQTILTAAPSPQRAQELLPEAKRLETFHVLLSYYNQVVRDVEPLLLSLVSAYLSQSVAIPQLDQSQRVACMSMSVALISVLVKRRCALNCRVSLLWFHVPFIVHFPMEIEC